VACLAYAIVSIVWGTTFLAIAYAVGAFTPMGLSCARFLPAGLLALAIGRVRREAWPARGDLPHIALVGVLLLTVCMSIIGWAEQRLSSGVAVSLGATVPLFLGLFEPVGLDRRGWLGLVVGFGGVLLLVWPSGQSPDLMAALALMASAAVWSYGTLHGRRHPSRAGHFTAVGIEMLVAGVAATLALPFAGGFMHGRIEVVSLGALAYLIVFGSVLAYSAYIYLAGAWTPARAGTYAYWNPVVGVALGWAVRHETVHRGMMPGLVLILAGVALLQYPRRGTASRDESPATS
jgi:drug/metabolite transporter (DMT)-like permease